MRGLATPSIIIVCNLEMSRRLQMVKASDFIEIPYSPDMTQGGIAYACKSLHYTYDRMGSSPFKRLQRIVAGVAVELAFRRHLVEMDVPHNNLGATPFTDPDRYDIAIGGRRCDIKSFLVTNKDRIREIREDPTKLENAQALIPTDQFASSHLYNDDIYIFAFLAALLTPNQRTLEKAIQAKQPIFLIFPLPKNWARPKTWQSLGKIAIKSNSTKSIKLELGGQDKEQNPISEQIILKPKTRITCQHEFYALHYLHTPNFPDGSLGIHSKSFNETHIIEPMHWGNIWIYGLTCIFTGYITRKEYRKLATELPAGSHVFQYPRTSTSNLSMDINDLHPLTHFFERAKSWSTSSDLSF